MKVITNKSFKEMSLSFQKAFGYSNSKLYRQSLPLYERAIQEDKNNFAALNNIGVAKISIGIEDEDEVQVLSGINDIKEAIRITQEVYEYPEGYPLAQKNLEWAEAELAKI
jgi:tetratricopeptide (TPR) repeat protein